MQLSKQRGAVLILALLIVALVAGLAVNYASQMQLVQARAVNGFYGAQQELWSDSMVPFAIGVLKYDANNSTTDHAEEDWAKYPVSESIPGGSLMGSLSDAQALININSLDGGIQNQSNPLDPGRFTEPQRRFIRFLQTFDGVTADPDDPLAKVIIDMNLAVAITEAVVDWIDNDDNTIGYGGAEALQYQQAGVSWVPPNELMESLQELRLVQGITPEIYQAISPYLVVLPNSQTKLNINTIRPERSMRILQTLNAPTDLLPLQAQALEGFASWRGESGFAAPADLANNPDFSAILPGTALDVSDLTVSSEYFWLNTEVQIEDKIVNRRILLFRDSADVKVVARYAAGQSTSLQSLMDKSSSATTSNAKGGSGDRAETKNDNNDANTDRRR
ncbi:type II secretion system minor pseudopilin GspK [Simiduia curdlanivorans]|uniref:Type II secretion system minor pseudopilin GspK n=1 Tax=Simiduia curdlanivorans TaxID=1492769 RepID=A0ABV8V1K4_9GAMM|nr:type II secretion system minor pseudopilin GspK [Simiduia curdlanivorans]MDN3638055.1 type II secretion system minor pseudopilin GspK [Simiduia curdlanivorans]